MPLILKVREIIFYFVGKTHNGAFWGILRGRRDLFDLWNFPASKDKDKVREKERQRERERKRERESASDCISKLPGPKWKIREIFIEKSGIVCSTQSLVIVMYLLPHWIQNRPGNRNVRKICMILVSAVRRPEGHKISLTISVLFVASYSRSTRQSLYYLARLKISESIRWKDHKDISGLN